jgi:ABC-2 type transport system permease protein
MDCRIHRAKEIAIMNSPLLSIALLDLLRWQRMPLAIASALIPPMGMAVLLIVLTFSVTAQPVVLVVNAHGIHAQRMEQIIKSDEDAYLLSVADEETAKRMLQTQEVAAIITIPEDFDTKVPNHEGKVILTLNNIDIDFADDIRRSVDRSVAQFDAPVLSLAGQKGEMPGSSGEEDEEVAPVNSYRIVIHEVDLRKTNVDFLSYQVLPVLILLVLSVGLIGTALLCAQDGEIGTAKVLLLAPVRAWVVIGGRLLGGLLASLIVLIPVLIICTLTGVIAPLPSHWPALMGLFVATGMCASGLGAILGSLLHGSRVVAMAASVIATYLFFLGGGFTTIAFLPRWLQIIASFVPIRYAIDGLRQTLFYDELTGVQLDLLVLVGTAVGAVVLGSMALRRSWRSQ